MNMSLDKFTKIILIFSVLLVAFSAFYYFVIFLPQKEEAKIELEKEQQAQKQQEQKKEELERKKQQLLLDACLKDAYETYTADWTNACKLQAKRITEGIQSCISGYLTESDCKKIWGEPDDSPDCSLPADTADTLEKRLQQNKDECFKKYPQK